MKLHSIVALTKGRQDFALLLVVVLFPLIVGSPYVISVGITVAIYSMVALGLGLLLGYAGQISMGQAGFFGVGAYTAAILATNYGVPPLLALLAAVVVSMGLAYLIGLPILKLRGYFLALATLGFNVICYVFFSAARWLTKGESGITGIPYFSVLGFSFNNIIKNYYLAFAALAVIYLFSKNLVSSKVGRGLRAISSNEDVAAALGINTARYKLTVFAIAGAYAGLAGAVYAFYVSAVSPPSFQFFVSIQMVMFVVIGGAESLYGPMAGALIVTILNELLARYQEYSLSVYGALIVVMLALAPNGLTKSFRVTGALTAPPVEAGPPGAKKGRNEERR